MNSHSGKRLRAFKSAIPDANRCGAGVHVTSVQKHRTLIDVLEPRLLFSADHPLGLFINPADDVDRMNSQWDGVELLALYEKKKSDSTDGDTHTVDSADSDGDVVDDGAIELLHSDKPEQTPDEVTIEAVSLNSDLGENLILADTGDVGISIIQVTTTDDTVDAVDTSSIEALNNDVGSDGEVSLREAILVANVDSRVEVIRLSDETYTLQSEQSSQEDDESRNGDLDLSGTYSIQGVAGANTEIKQADKHRRVFELHSGSLTISDIKIKDGAVNSQDSGGGMFIHADASAIIENVVFENNSANHDGGALFVSGIADSSEIDVTLKNVTISGSEANRGAGIFITDAANVAIADSVLSDNNAKTYGGAIYNQGSLALTDSALIGNSADSRGGGFLNNGDASLERVTVWANDTSGSGYTFGAGIYSDTLGKLDISYSVVAYNTSEWFSAGLALMGKADISDSLVIENISNKGSAVVPGAGGIGLHNSLLASNPNIVSITNTVVANNTYNGNESDISSTSLEAVISKGFNFVEALTPSFASLPSDILEQDLSFLTVALEDNRARVTVTSTTDTAGATVTSATVDSGHSAGIGAKTVDGAIVGDTPNIGGYSHQNENGMVFWSDTTGAIYRSDATFSYAQEIIPSTYNPLGIEVDTINHRVYWLDSTDGSMSIKSAKYDGTDIMTERLIDQEAVAFALDPDAENINARFFVATAGQTLPSRLIQYFEKDIYNPESETQERAGTLIMELDGKPTGIELRPDGEVLFWSEIEGTGSSSSIRSILTTPYGEALGTQILGEIPSDEIVIVNPYTFTYDDSDNELFWTEPSIKTLLSYTEGDSVPIAATINDDVTPTALAYDNFNDRLLVGGNNKDVYWVDSIIENYSEIYSAVNDVTHMAFADIGTYHAPELLLPQGLVVQHGSEAPVSLDNIDALDQDTPARELTFSVPSSSDWAFKLNGIVVNQFSKQDVADGHVTFLHRGLQPFGDYTIAGITVEDMQSTTAAQAMNLTVTSIDPVFAPDPVFNVLEGGSVWLNNEVLRVVDPDTLDEDVVFTLVSQVEGVLLVDGSARDYFSLEQLKMPEIVEFRHSGAEPSVSSYLELEVWGGYATKSMPRIEMIVSPTNDSAPVAINHTAAAKHGVNIDTIGAAETSLLYGMSDADEDHADSFNVTVIDNPQYGQLEYSSADGTFVYRQSEVPVAPLDSTYSDLFSYQITDGAGNLSNIATVRLDILPLESPSIDDYISDASASELTPFSLDLSEWTVSSVDGEGPFSWYISHDGAPLPDSHWLSLHENTGMLSGIPDDGDSGVEVYSVTVSDNNGLHSSPVLLSIQVQDVNQRPIIDSISTIPVVENLPGVLVATVAASDPDAADSLEYSVVNDQQSPFTFVGNELWLKPGVSLDYESGSEILVKINVADSSEWKANITQEIIINVTDVNDAPKLILQSQYTVLENEGGYMAGTVMASDQDVGDELTFSVNDSRFELSLINGSLSSFERELKLKDGESLNYELHDGIEVTVRVEDNSSHFDSQVISIAVVDDQAPTFVGPFPSINATESQNYRLDLPDSLFSSADGFTTFTWEITRMGVELPEWLTFERDPVTGHMSLTGNPADSDTGTLSLEVTVSDANNLRSVPVPLTIEVVNINQNPVIANVSDMSIAENDENAVVGILSTSDPDYNDYSLLRYSISGGRAADLFSIDSTSGELRFNSAPDYEALGDIYGPNGYEVSVLVDDQNGGADEKTFFVKVDDVNEAPVIIADQEISVDENQPLALNVETFDVDGDVPVYSIIGGSAAELFQFQGMENSLIFITDPNFEALGDLYGVNGYEVEVRVEDQRSGSDEKTFFVKVNDVNDDPLITSEQNINVDENQLFVLNIESIDEDGASPVYSIIGGAAAELFEIQDSSNSLTFKAVPDFEALGGLYGDNGYEVTVLVDDKNGGADEKTFYIKVHNVNEDPWFTSEQEVSVDENQSLAISLESDDVDGDTPVYSIIGGAAAELFEIQDSSNSLTFKAVPDFEALGGLYGDNGYEVTVLVDDQNGGADEKTIYIKVHNVNEDPWFTSEQEVSVDENQSLAISLESDDVDGDTPVYSIIGGAAAELFEIQDSSNSLTFKAVPDFEALGGLYGDNGYEVTVLVDDQNGGADEKTIYIKVHNVNENPWLTSEQEVSVDENQSLAISLESDDVDGGTPVYSIIGGAAAELFEFQDGTSVLSFKVNPDYEQLGDFYGDKGYEVILLVEDNNNGTDQKTFYIHVDNVNEPPLITSEQNIYAPENQILAINIEGVDLDGDALEYSIVGGGDAELFEFHRDTAVLNFKDAPDFESKKDVDDNNVYELTVQVSDGNEGMTTQALSVRVEDVNDAPVAIGQMESVRLDADRMIDLDSGYFVDQDSDTLRFTMTLSNGQPLPEWIVFDKDTKELRLGIPPLELTNEQVLLKADDKRGGSAELIFEISFVPTIEPTDLPLQSAIPTVQKAAEISASDFDSLNSAVLPIVRFKQGSIVSENAETGTFQSPDSEDAAGLDSALPDEAVVNLSVDRMTELLTAGDSETSRDSVLRDNVISDFLARQSAIRDVISDTVIRIDVFDDSVNIANLFAMAREQDAEMFSILSNEFVQQRAEFDSQVESSRGTAGSAISVTSGLSVGYILYLLRGGAIMSSMLTSLPAWRFVDPLPILGTLDGSLGSDDETLQSIISDTTNRA